MAFRGASAQLKLMLSERAGAPAIRNVLERAGDQASIGTQAAAPAGRQTANLRHPGLEECRAKATAPHSHLEKCEDPGAKTEPGAPRASEISSAVLAVGPEGGWTDEELAAAERAGFQSVSLGRLIFRAETAVTAALAVVNYALGTTE
jgi:16S rRNA U1498 N3-methylase RsmE